MFNDLLVLFQKRNTNTAETPAKNFIHTMHSQEKTPDSDEYGVGILPFALESGDYGWVLKTHKRVTLVNAKEFKEAKFTISDVAFSWENTGHKEWEYWLAFLFMDAIKEALDRGRKEADITDLFNRDLLASQERVFTQKQIYDHIISFFEVVSESNKELKLKLKARI